MPTSHSSLSRQFVPARPAVWLSYGLASWVMCLLPMSGAAAQADAELVATFEGGRITLAEVRDVIAHRMPAEQARLAHEEGARELVESLIRYDLLVREAEARGYGERLHVRDATRHKASELFVQARTAVDPKSIAAADVAREHQARRHEFERPALRRASHIVLATRTEASALLAQLKHTDREHFARIASERSIDTATQKQGGELGYFTQSGQTDQGRPAAVPAPLVAAAFALAQAGAVAAQPIAVPNGFSVLMLTGIMPAHAAPAREVEEQLRVSLADAQQKEKLAALERDLAQQYKPVVHPELVDALDFPDDSTPARIPEGFPAAPPDPRVPPKLLEPDGY